jgi:hypothetical protein
MRFQEKVENQYKDYMKGEEKYIKSRNKDKITDYKRNFDLIGSQGLQISKMERERQLALRKVLDEQVHKHQQEK